MEKKNLGYLMDNQIKHQLLKGTNQSNHGKYLT